MLYSIITWARVAENLLLRLKILRKFWIVKVVMILFEDELIYID
jgi:hypothetical protein